MRPTYRQEGKGKRMSGEVRDAEWFKERLQERGVCGLEIVWGNYRDHFNEIPEDLIFQYLSHRPRLLHKQALEAARFEREIFDAHPFMSI